MFRLKKTIQLIRQFLAEDRDSFLLEAILIITLIVTYWIATVVWLLIFT